MEKEVISEISSPKRMFGILRHPDTPGTGQSVRFGRRLYDDGDESRMSDMDSISSLPKVETINSEGNSRDNTAKRSATNDTSIVSDASLSLLNLPMMEGYSDLHDASLLQEDDATKQDQLPSNDYAVPGPSFDSDFHSEYKTATSPSSTRIDVSAHSDWATPKSRMSSDERDEKVSETFAVKLDPETSFSDLSIPWSQHAALPSPVTQNLQLDVSQMQDMSSVYFPGSLGRSVLSKNSPQKIEEEKSITMAPLTASSELAASTSLADKFSPFGEILDVSTNMDRVHTERTAMLLSRLHNAQEMYAQMQKELESERSASQKARDELALEKKKANEKSEEHSQEMEHVRSLVAHLTEQSLRRKKEDSVLKSSLLGSNDANNSLNSKDQSKEMSQQVGEADAHSMSEQEGPQTKDDKAELSGSSPAEADKSEADVKDAEKEDKERDGVLQSQLDKMKRLIEKSSEEKSQYEARIQDLDEMHYSVKLQLEEAEKDKDSMREQLDSLNEQLSTLIQEKEALLEDAQKRDIANQHHLDEQYVAKKDHDELLDLAEQMQARIDMIQNERTDERKRVTSLEKELSNRGITIANLEKMHERLEEENLNLGIALSSKQQELSLLKRLGTKPLSSQTPRSTIRNRLAVRDLVMQSRTPITLKKDNSEGENTAKALPLQDLTTNQTIKSIDDTHINDLPPLRKGPSHLRATRRKTIDGKPLLEDELSNDPARQSKNKTERSITSSPASKAMPPPPITRKSQSNNRSSTSNVFESSRTMDNSRTGSISNKVMKSSSAFGGGPRSSIAGSRYSTSSMSSSISAIRGPMDLSELTSSHN